MFDIAENANLPTGARIKVIGVGGGGCNAVNTMIRSGLTGVEYIVANTDSQALNANLAGTKIQLGGNVTKGLGAGANPEVGRKAAIEDYEKLSEVLDGADMVFVTAGMGGGTGTGAAPVIAKLSREMGALTVGVVTKPFLFEGKKRSRQAEEGISSLEESVDSLICIPNQRLLQLAGENLSLVDTFKAADEVLLNAVQGISDLINNTGLINADFADVSTVMTNKGMSLMGTGTSSGPDRAIKAAKLAISSPLLEDVTIDGSTGIIINITGSSSLTTHETNQAVTLIMEAADEDAEIIFGTVIDENMGEDVKVTVIATGLRTSKSAKIEVTPSVNTHAQVQTQIATPVAPQATATVSSPRPTVEATMQKQPTPPAPSSVQVSEPKYQQPVQTTVHRAEARFEHKFEAPEAPKNTDYAVKEEIVFDFDQEDKVVPERPRINWAEKLQSAASKYDSQKTMENHPLNSSVQGQGNSQIEKPKTYVQEMTNHANDNQIHSSSNPTRETRIKSIAEKLGFFNFDEDEFDTPSFMKKPDRSPETQM